MGNDLKEFDKETMVELVWHGDDTLVRLEPNAEKVPVAKGETIKVLQSRAKELLRYSHQWTLPGKEPVVHPYEKARDERFKREAKSEASDAGSDANKPDPSKAKIDDLTDDQVDAMKAKAKVGEQLAARSVRFNLAGSTLDELKALLKEKLKEERAAAVQATADAGSDANQAAPNAAAGDADKKE